jgi:hypothetical protein
MNVRSAGISASLLLAALAVACSSESRRSGFEEQSASATDPDGENAADFGGGNTSAGEGCSFEDDIDHDGDGLSFKDGDCNDCHPGIHPGFFDVPGTGLDEDCSGVPDDGDAQCDDGLDINGSDPYDAAKAIGLCKKATANGAEWGVIEAKYVYPDGNPASVNLDVGLLKKFGVNAPQAGDALLAISSGYARAPGDPGYKAGVSRSKGGLFGGTSHGAPAGYPKEFAGCPDDTEPTGAPQDGIGLELKIRVPLNAQSFSYDQNFFTYEYSQYVCTKYNDFFVALLQPKLPDLPDENIAFDSLNNPISVNNGLFQVCRAGTHKGKTYDCPLGTDTLSGTGFDAGGNRYGATGWLTTTAPVEGGKEITVRYAVWDSGDGNFDSTVLLDNFKWSVDATGAPQTSPGPN